VEKVKTAAQAEELVRKTIEYLRKRVRVDRAVLFGSYARGDAS
jgi:predicted nucleotidyltransferase